MIGPAGAHRVVLALACVTALGACTRRPPAPAAHASYTVGAAYRAGSTWFYPREQFRYDVTGLAAVAKRESGLTADGGASGLTADGERAEPDAMTAAHQTLQLPAVARVTNLENGRTALVRINDRGPADPGRVIALSPKAAAVLGAGEGTRVRVELDEAMSRAAADATGTAPSLAIAAAPVQSVRAETLPPPPGIAASAGGRAAPVEPGVADVAAALPAAAVPALPPATFTQGAASPGQLFIRASEFGRRDYAEAERRKMPGLPVEIERVHEPRQDRFRVRAGPFATVGQADAALKQALDAGVADARIVVEQE